MNARKWIPGIVIGCFGLLVLLAAGGFFFLRSQFGSLFTGAEREAPDLGPPRVVTGAGLLSQSPFLSDPKLGAITGIKVGKVDRRADVVAAVAGEDGAAYVTRDGAIKSSVEFDDSYDRVEVVDVEGDGVCEFMNRGSWGSDPALFGHDGKTLWTYHAPSGADDMCAGDIDHDGKLEFAVGCNGGGGLHLLGPDGRERWRQSGGNIWHVEMADTTGRGDLRILHSDASGQLTVRDARGAAVAKLQLAGSGGPFGLYLSDFTTCGWPPGAKQEVVVAPGSKAIDCYLASGQPAATLSAPGASDKAEVRATPVTFRAGAPAYLAVALDFDHGARGVLYVYDPKGALVYQETLAGPCRALAALPLGGAEALLVGRDGRATKYTWNATAAPGGK